MPSGPDLAPLLAYTDWLRSEWKAHFSADPDALSVGVGAHADARFASVGDLVRHVFSAEIRYVDRILGREARDVGGVPVDSVSPLFQLGAESRVALRDLLSTRTSEEWEQTAVYPIGSFEFEGTPWKIVIHILIHEIRHWAQIGTILRQVGKGPALHDFLVSPVLGGDFRRRA